MIKKMMAKRRRYGSRKEGNPVKRKKEEGRLIDKRKGIWTPERKGREGKEWRGERRWRKTK